MSNFDYIRTHYGVPAELGRIVEMNGRRGVIVKDCGNYVGVNFDDNKPHVVSRCHPTWEMQYLGMGTIREVKSVIVLSQECPMAQKNMII